MTTVSTPRHAILIAGMHRSGTSAMARVLNLLGADLGDGLLPARDDNPRGYWESAEIVALNDQCLGHFGCSWDNPQPLPNGWEHTRWVSDWGRELAESLAVRHGNHPLIAIKDPRVSRLLPGWLPVLKHINYEPHVVLALRHPDEVAASLGARPEAAVDPVTARLLWLTYTLAAEADSRGVRRSVLSYDALLEDWRHVVATTADELGIPWPVPIGQAADAVDDFLTPKLHRQRAADLNRERSTGLAARCITLYESLSRDRHCNGSLMESTRQRLAEDVELLQTTATVSFLESTKDESADSLWTQMDAVPLQPRVYFTDADGHYDESRSVEVLLPPSRGVRSATFRILDPAHARQFRFDPNNAPGIYRILSIAVGAQQISAADLDVLAVSGTRLPNDQDGAVRIMANNRDPWVEFSLTHFENEMVHARHIEIHFERESLIDGVNRALYYSAEQITSIDDSLNSMFRQMDSLHGQIETLQGRLTNTETEAQARAARHEMAMSQLRDNSNSVLLASAAQRHRTQPASRAAYALNITPNQDLQLLAARADTDLRLWASTGPVARFTLAPTTGRALPAGWYVMALDLQSIATDALLQARWITQVDGKEVAHTLGLSAGSLRQRPLLHLDAPVGNLLLEPCAGCSDCRFLLGSTVSLRPLGNLEVLLRLGVPAVRRYRAAGGRWSDVWRETRKSLMASQTLETLHRNAQVPGTPALARDYTAWIEAFDRIDDTARKRMDADILTMAGPPLISIVMPVYNTPQKWLQRCIDSVLAQRYPHWELCIADDASTAPHIRDTLNAYANKDARIKVVYRKTNGHISAASNSALALATGDWVALLDHDDELPEHALYLVAKEIMTHPDCAMIYSDEDKIDEAGRRFDPYFKPDWNLELFLGQNMFCHLGVFKRSLLQRIDGFRTGFEGSQDHDLALRASEHVRPDQIRHIPHVLYHWRAIQGSTALATGEKDYATEAAARAVTEYLARNHMTANVEPMHNGYRRVRFALPAKSPLVTLIIPTRNRLDLLRRCVDSILQLTDYQNYEILIVDNRSDDAETLHWLRDVQIREPRVRVLAHDEPFNFSRINNHAVEESHGDVVGLINNDIEARHADWLGEMVSHAVHRDVGAVGAKLYYPDGRIQHAGVTLGFLGVAVHPYCRMPHDYPGQMGRAMLTQELSAVTAACLVIRKSVYQQAGGMNEDLAVAFNDIDFCLRVRRCGYRNIFTPFAELTHHESATRGYEDNPEKKARFEREVHYMIDRWGDQLRHDPFYNPNLALRGEPFTLNFDLER